MHEQRCFVQFMHPGGEHRPDAGDVRTWNTGRHQRKFMVCTGETASDQRERELMFWGEWEPPSDVIERVCASIDGGPRYIYRPFWSPPRSMRLLQNTDPFVFGGFYYSICKQVQKSGRPTQLRLLKPGSVILFGSHLRGEFVLDTVFVVRNCVDHNDRDYREAIDGLVPEHYASVVLAPFYSNRDRETGGCATATQLRLYVGATVDDPFEGMYSFFPCREYAGGPAGFARPRIRLPGLVNSVSKQATRLNRDTDPAQFPQLWRDVRDQVQEQGCELGVRAQFTERR